MDDENLKAKNFPAEIADFYDAIVEKVAALRLSAHQTIASVKKEQEELASKLQENLAKGESLRKADFKKLLGEVIEKRKGREQEVMEMLAQFQKEEQEMAQGLKKLFGNGKQVRLSDFKSFITEAKGATEVRKEKIEEITKASEDIRKSAEETIAKFREEREEMAKEWQLLARKMQEKRAKAKKQEEK
ncbi:MAG: hypothetical protein Q8N71_01995 [candidate division Zixibacteria bacterium]|nr:hypothetical protein [candidate division Zixibacteria bacterium]